MSNITFLENKYDDLVRDYGGKVILIREEKIIFADISSKVVINYAKNKFKDRNYLITRIDSGEAALYGFTFSNKKNSS